MAGTQEKPEEIVSKLRQVDVLQGQGATVGEAVHQIGVTQKTFYRWRKLYGGMQRLQLARLKELEKCRRFPFCNDALLPTRHPIPHFYRGNATARCIMQKP